MRLWIAAITLISTTPSFSQVYISENNQDVITIDDDKFVRRNENLDAISIYSATEFGISKETVIPTHVQQYLILRDLEYQQIAHKASLDRISIEHRVVRKEIIERVNRNTQKAEDYLKFDLEITVKFDQETLHMFQAKAGIFKSEFVDLSTFS